MIFTFIIGFIIGASVHIIVDLIKYAQKKLRLTIENQQEVNR